MSNPRSVKYRRLAPVEPDQAKGQLLYRMADEADRGVLFASDRLYSSTSSAIEIKEASKDNPLA